MPDNELAALIAKADRGDLEAVSRVWQEYAFTRKDARNGAIWKRRAIREGAPDALSFLADQYLWQGEDAKNHYEKVVFANSALALLERASMNRHAISQPHQSDDFDDAAHFAHQLRTTRAVVAVLRDGLEPYVKRANSGDPIAAYHVAVHHFWIKLDQDKRAVWEHRASTLGDPSFAGTALTDYAPGEALRDIRKALADRKTMARAGDQWMQTQLRRDLLNRARRI